jgi:nucleoside 2-deoxyribosyltransferase
MINDPPLIYLAGPDLCYPQAESMTADKKAICEMYGLEGIAPSDMEQRFTPVHRPDAGLASYRSTVDLLTRCDGLVVNMNPFRGPSMDVGAAFEMGYMTALGRPVVGYTADQQDYAARLTRLHEVFDNPLQDHGDHYCTPDGLKVENFGLTDNYLVSGAALAGSTAITEDFESAVRWVRRLMFAD